MIQWIIYFLEENKYHDVIYNIKICSRQSVYSDGIVNRRKFKDEDVKADRQNVFDYSFCTECNTHLTHDDKKLPIKKTSCGHHSSGVY